MGRIKAMGLSVEELKEPFALTDEEKDTLSEFLNGNKSAMDEEERKRLVETITQDVAHFGQLLNHSESFISEEAKQKKEEFDKKMESLSSLDFSSLKSFCREVIEEYQQREKEVVQFLGENDDKKEEKEQVLLIKDCLDQLDEVILEEDSSYDEQLSKLKDCYQKAISLNDDSAKKQALEDLLTISKSMISMIEEMKKPVGSKEHVFDLFAKINDQIVNHHYIKMDNKTYAMYELEDGSNYYAIIKDEGKVLEEDQSFVSLLPTIKMDRDSVEGVLKTVLFNAIYYYDLNEYMRYIEMSYKGQMTKEIDQIIMQYKTRLSERESVLKSQLQFLDDFAPIINGKQSEKYPNISYTDTYPKDFYPEEAVESNLVDEALREQRSFIQNVLGSEDVPKTLTNRDILLVIYGKSEIENLINSSFEEKKEDTASPPTVEEEAKEEEKAPTLVTNAEKISNYVKTRLDEIDLVVKNEKPNVNVTENKNSLYQMVNPILDLNMAIAITDSKYSKGQGVFATIRYLKTGETTGFTSENGARGLVEKVDRKGYLSSLMENMIKSLAGSGKKSEEDNTYLNRMASILTFTKKELENPEFSPNDMARELLNNDELLKQGIENYDYDYIDPLSESSKLLAEKLEEGVVKNNPSAIKIKDALIKIKNFSKDETVDITTFASNSKTNS